MIPLIWLLCCTLGSAQHDLSAPVDLTPGAYYLVPEEFGQFHPYLTPQTRHELRKPKATALAITLAGTALTAVSVASFFHFQKGLAVNALGTLGILTGLTGMYNGMQEWRFRQSDVTTNIHRPFVWNVRPGATAQHYHLMQQDKGLTMDQELRGTERLVKWKQTAPMSFTAHAAGAQPGLVLKFHGTPYNLSDSFLVVKDNGAVFFDVVQGSRWTFQSIPT